MPGILTRKHTKISYTFLKFHLRLSQQRYVTNIIFINEAQMLTNRADALRSRNTNKCVME